MSGQDSGPDATGPRVEPDPPSAEAERSRWPGWIWGIPIAAVLIVGWLAFRQLAASGPLVTVIFDGAHGISAGQTSVEYNGLKVGEVESLKLERDLLRVRTTIRLDADMADHIGPGTVFWIIGPSLSDLSSIRSVISGPSIGMQPANGPKQKEYQGLTEAPVVPETVQGTRFTLRAGALGSVSRGSHIYFHDLAVGKVEQTTLRPDRRFDISVFVRAPYDKLVRDNTRFWNAGAVQISLAGAGPRIQLQSLPALLSGAVDFETPSGLVEAPVATEGHPFQLFDSKDAAEYAPGTRGVRYRVVFGADAGALARGAAVTLAGTQVGSVESAQLQYDQATGTLLEAVTFAIDPDRIALTGGANWPPKGRAEMDTLMDHLIGQGLRAEPGSTIPLVGSKTVALTFVKAPGPATLIAGDPPGFPTESGGSGLDGIVTAVSGIASKLDSLPLDQIADNVKTITSRAAALSESPALTEGLDKLHQAVDNVGSITATAKTDLPHALNSLNQALANVEKITVTAKADIPSLLAALKKVATEAGRTVADARQLVSSTSGSGPLGTNAAGLTQTLYEVSRAARSIRELTDYLDRHPSALIRGRQ